MAKIQSVAQGSYGERAGIRAGDELVSLNGHEIRDVLDYRFYLAERKLTVVVRTDGKERTVRIRKGEYDDVGLGFETPLMDKKQHCANRCIFCFIDQLPKGMRETLYFKDDDSRLSFLQGNYITMTNLRREDLERILSMHISPINVSVHTTDPSLRCEMMKNPHAAEIMDQLSMLAEGGCELHCQIVLCRGINDGAQLERTMRDLYSLYPAVSSCSVIPAGLTKHRDGLYPLRPYEADEAKKVIGQVTAFADECYEKTGSRIFFCGDELYLTAGMPVPDGDYYEGYPQLENGVGMIASFKEESETALDEIGERLSECRLPRSVSVATGYAAYDLISETAEHVSARVPGLTVHVYRIRNDFFGESITVSGLITGGDLIAQLSGKPLGDELLIPSCALRADGEVFLDDVTPAELSEKLGVAVHPSDTDGASFVWNLLGL